MGSCEGRSHANSRVWAYESTEMQDRKLYRPNHFIEVSVQVSINGLTSVHHV